MIEVFINWFSDSLRKSFMFACARRLIMYENTLYYVGEAQFINISLMTFQIITYLWIILRGAEIHLCFNAIFQSLNKGNNTI